MLTVDEVEIDEGWRLDASCEGLDSDLFFVERGASTIEARRVCAECRVMEECLVYALAKKEKFGIWGGLSERERRKIRTIDDVMKAVKGIRDKYRPKKD